MAPPKDKRLRKKDDRMTPKDPMSKDQKAIAKWLRRNVPTKKTKFMHSHVVEYFTGSNAVDMLLEDSPWAKKNVKNPETQLFFEFRDHCVDYLDDLLKHKMFHRAKKIPVDSDMLKNKKKKKENAADQETDDGNKSDAKQIAEKKKKRKIRLDMHLEQIFLDSKGKKKIVITYYYLIIISAIDLKLFGKFLFFSYSDFTKFFPIFFRKIMVTIWL